MAISPVTPPEAPHKAIADVYSVQQRGHAYPVLITRVLGVMRKMEDPVVINLAEDSDLDGFFTDISVPSWVGRTDLVGKLVYLPDETEVGYVVAWDNTTTTASLDVGFALDPTGQEIQIQAHNDVNAPSYYPASGDRTIEISVPMNTPEAIAYVQDRMSECYFDAVRTLLDELGDTTITDAQIFGALQSLGAGGISIDTFLGEQAERMESDRRAGTLPAGSHTMP